MIPIDIPLTVMAEILVTNMVGIMFWFAFQEAAEQRAFRVPLRMMHRVYSTTSDLTCRRIGFKFRTSANSAWARGSHRQDQLYLLNGARFSGGWWWWKLGRYFGCGSRQVRLRWRDGVVSSWEGLWGFVDLALTAVIVCADVFGSRDT